MYAVTRIAPVLALAVSAASADWTLQDIYDAGNWFDMFTVQSISDPTNGFVNYLTQSQAQSLGLYQVINNRVFIGVDNTTILDPYGGVGRNSVRLMSNNAYNHGLVIADFQHIPGSCCGSWPAFWMVGPNWPNGGEIDIIEGVNDNAQNQMTLHTAPGCTVSVGAGGQTGTSIGDPNCGDGGGYDGCPVVDYASTSYGTEFDAAGGGVYATQWTSSGIMIWYFRHGSVPADIRQGKPNPARWGTPAANFGGCEFDDYFMDMSIVFDNTFCGDWAGAVWGQSACSARHASCTHFVAREPKVYETAYWLVNSVKVYTNGD